MTNPVALCADHLAIHPVILCGGSGTRLWPLSRKAFPKQFIPLIGEKSLLQLTLERVTPLLGSTGASITCVASEEHRFLVADVADQAGVAVCQILEPQPKNTAAAMALAALAAPADALLVAHTGHAEAVKPGASLSLQMHHHRAEHWIVVSGTAEVTNGDKVTVLGENQSTFIPLGQIHRLANPGKVPLEIIEVQSGAYLGEDDIVRFDDSYGRH